MLNPVHGSASYCITSRIGPPMKQEKFVTPILPAHCASGRTHNKLTTRLLQSASRPAGLTLAHQISNLQTQPLKHICLLPTGNAQNNRTHDYTLAVNSPWHCHKPFSTQLACIYIQVELPCIRVHTIPYRTQITLVNKTECYGRQQFFQCHLLPPAAS